MTETLPARRAQTNGPAPLLNVSDPVQLGEVLAKSGYFSDAKDAAKAAVKVMAGQELGFGPIASMTGVHIIQGKPSVGANLMAALVKRSKNYRYTVTALTDERCSIAFYERAGEEWVPCGPESVFTLDDAKRAGVAGKDNWKHYPRNMLFARALSNGVTWYCPDVTGGSPLYTPEELGAEVDGETGDVIDAPRPEIVERPELPVGPQGTDAPTITKAQAKALVDRAWDIGIEPDRLQLAASHVLGDDVGDCSTKGKATDALAKLNDAEAVRVGTWLHEKADQQATSDE